MAFRVAWLFAAYGTIGYGGDYAAGLLAQDRVGVVELETIHELDPEVEVVVDVKPEIVVDVLVRRSGECTYALGHEVTIPVQGVERLNIDAGSGELHVEGQRELDQIVVVGQACASVEEWLDELMLTVEEGSSGQVTLRSHYPSDRNRGHGDNTARMDLTVLVPLGFDVAIDDSSGEITVTGTGNLWIDDSSGGIDVYGINGDVHIDDSSAGVSVRDVAGDVEVDDGSGGIEIRDVEGSVAVNDGSGGIDISEVDQDVLIVDDGSGSIDVSNVGGDFIVADKGNGSITYSNVDGEVNVPEDKRRRRRRPGR